MELAIIYALLGAFSFAARNVLIRIGLVSAKPSIGVFTSLIMSLPVVGPLSLATGGVEAILSMELVTALYLALSGILHLQLGRQFSYTGVKLLGAARASPLLQTTTLFSVLLSVLILGEEVSLALGLGIAFVFMGILLIARSEVALRSAIGKASKYEFIKGFAAVFGAVALWSLTPILMKLGIAGLGSAITANLVASLFALGTTSITLVGKGEHREMRSIKRRPLAFLLAAGFFAGLAQLFNFMALEGAPVVIVYPLFNSTALFTVLLAYVFVRRLELISSLVVLGAISTFIGITLITPGLVL